MFLSLLFSLACSSEPAPQEPPPAAVEPLVEDLLTINPPPTEQQDGDGNAQKTARGDAGGAVY